MRFCYDFLDSIYLTKNGYFRKGTVSYIEKSSCKNCGDPYLTPKKKPSEYCSKSCAKLNMSEKTKTLISKSKSKGGVIKFNLPLFETYNSQLSVVEKSRPHFSNGLKLLTIKCTKCGNWFVPTRSSVKSRLDCLNGNRDGESRFYCSDKCKNECEIFGKNYKSYIGNILQNYVYTKAELEIWSQEVLVRANYRCEICGKKAEHAHHIQPKKLEPGLALDPENGLAVCEKCHYKYGHRDECSSGRLSAVNCKGEV